MKIRLPAALVLGLALAGCASVDDIASRDPTFFGSSARNAADYSNCVAAAWEGQGQQVERTPIQDGYRVSASSSISVEAVLDVITWRGQTDVKLYTRLPSRGQPLIESANLCM
ncbi:hypothetical protein [Bordetella sp. 2513F-2]